MKDQQSRRHLSLRSEQLGILLLSDTWYACLMRGGQEVWTTTRPRLALGDEYLELATLIADSPRARLSRKRCVVALGPDLVTTKRLIGIATAAAPRRKTGVRAVAESLDPYRHFVVTVATPRLSEVLLSPNGDQWAALFNGAWVDRITAIARSEGFSEIAVVPAAVLLPVGHALVDAERAVTSGVAGEAAFHMSTVATASLAASVVRASEIAVASAAAQTLHPPLRALSGLDPRTSRTRIAHMGWLTTLLTACVLGWIAASVVAASARARTLSVQQPALQEAQARTDSLRVITESLQTVDRFDRQTRPVIVLLSDIARTLDTLGTLDMLTLTDSTVDLRVEAEHGAVLPQSFASLEWVRSASLVGGVARTGDAASSAMERVNVRLRRSALQERPPRRTSAGSVAAGRIK